MEGCAVKHLEIKRWDLLSNLTGWHRSGTILVKHPRRCQERYVKPFLATILVLLPCGKKNIELAKYIGKIVNLYISAVLVLDSRRLCGALVFIQKRQRAHCGKKIYIFLNVRRI